MRQATAAEPQVCLRLGAGAPRSVQGRRAPHSSALSPYPLPRRAATQLRLALDALAGAPTDLPEAIPLRARADRVRVVLEPRLAWPDGPARARLADGSPAPRRSDFYDWILGRRRRAQMAARRAIE